MIKVNEIFYSLQGEGHFSGVPAVFIRLSGCNLRCPFCDTEHSSGTLMTPRQIAESAAAYPTRHAVITGGEPGLQLNDKLIDALHALGFYIQIETNGTVTLPEGIDWITCSPKGAEIKLKIADEIKVLFDGEKPICEVPSHLTPKVLSLQPLDCGDESHNNKITSAAIEYIKAHPLWRLSLQTHKLLDIR